MTCGHDGYHTVSAQYRHRDGVLVYFWICERCGMRLREVMRQPYRPDPKPHAGNQVPASASG